MKDARHFQMLFQGIFLTYGVTYLHWDTEKVFYLIYFATCFATQFICDYIRTGFSFKKFPFINNGSTWKSAAITAFGLSLLLKTTHWWICILAAVMSIASKYLLTWKKKHIFNPSAIGIVLTILLTNKAWISPGQWGSGAVIFFLVCSLGFIVVTRVQKIDISLAFLLTFVGLLFARQIIYQGWPLDFFFHSVSTGSLLLFSFFMISDPRTTPNHSGARILWAIGVAAVAFYLTAFKFINGAPVWVLVCASPLVPLFDLLFKARRFQWQPMVRFAGILALVPFLSSFCGIYVSKSDGTLKNKTSQVIMVRDDNRTAVTMYNDFKGDAKDFAMVVPVPVVLKKSDIKVVNNAIFKAFNDYSAPRLVEYYDYNPCAPMIMEDKLTMNFAATAKDESEVMRRAKYKGVTIEASYTVGEYDILILDAKESAGLKEWLTENGYKIPPSAEEVLEPYIKSNLKFFVVKVNLKEKDKSGVSNLRPLQIAFNSPKFMLPIRLGMANGDGDQDMVIYTFTRKGRVESTNYRTVTMPTAKNIPLFVQKDFGNFYANVFSNQWNNENRSVAFVEYAWDVSPSNYMKCDPCVSDPPDYNMMKEAGVWWIGNDGYHDYVNQYENDKNKVFFTRLHVRYNRQSFPQDIFFQVTPNTENYQARYIITHPATGDLTCKEGQKYLKELRKRRINEMEMLSSLTGKGFNDWNISLKDEEQADIPIATTYGSIAELMQQEREFAMKSPKGIILASALLLGVVALMRARRQTLTASDA